MHVQATIGTNILNECICTVTFACDIHVQHGFEITCKRAALLTCEVFRNMRNYEYNNEIIT